MRVQHSNRCQQRPHISRPHRCSSSKSQRQLVAGNRRCAASESTSMVARSAATWDCRPGYCRREGRRAGGQACAGTRQEVLTLDRGRWHQRLHQKRQHRQWRRPPPFTHSLTHSLTHSFTSSLAHLHLDCNLSAIVQPRPVHLGQRRRGSGQRRKLCKQLLRGGAQLLLQHAVGV